MLLRKGGSRRRSVSEMDLRIRLREKSAEGDDSNVLRNATFAGKRVSDRMRETRLKKI